MVGNAGTIGGVSEIEWRDQTGLGSVWKYARDKKNYGAMYLGCAERERERTVEMGKIKERKGEKFRERGTDSRKERESKSERGRDNEEKQIERQLNRQKHRKKEKNNLMRKPLDVESSGNRKKPPMI